MKEVKINNYIDNRIMLSSHKLKNEMQQLINSTKPIKPIVINNLNYYDTQQQQVQYQVTASTTERQIIKQSNNKKQKKKKKSIKSTTHLIQNKNKYNHKDQLKNKCNQYSNNKYGNNKKRSLSFSPHHSNKINLVDSIKKCKFGMQNNSKIQRTKSTVIKRNKSPTFITPDFIKTQKQQRQAKIYQNQKKNQSFKKNCHLKKNHSTLHLHQDKMRQSKKNPMLNSNQKNNLKCTKLNFNTTKTVRPTTKSYVATNPNLKQISARQKCYKEDKKKSINQKNLDNEAHHHQYITLKYLLDLEKVDETVKTAITKLQNVLNNPTNGKNLSNKLQLLVQKLQQIKNQTSIQQQQLLTHNINQINITQKNKQKQLSNNFISNQLSNIISSSQNNKQTKIKCYPINKSSPVNQHHQQDHQLLIKQHKNVAYRSYQEVIIGQPSKQQNTLISLRSNLNKIEIQYPDNENPFYNPLDDNQNPLIHRKVAGDEYLTETITIGYLNDDFEQVSKHDQITQLKKFKQQSNIMMQKIKNKAMLKQKKQKNIPLQQNNNNQIKYNIDNNKLHPINLQINNRYAFQKYPNLQNTKSPKLNTQQLNQAIRIRQEVFTDRHQKLSQLVNIMFQKKLFSPKTYSIQIHSLQQRQLQNNQTLDNYKKHAAELTKLLSDIKKQKQEIANIDEMIRLEKWDQSKNIILMNQTAIKNKNQQLDQKPPINKLILNLQPYNQAFSSTNPLNIDTQLTCIDLNLLQLQKNHKQITKSIQQSRPQSPLLTYSGFQSNLFFIKQYSIALCQFVLDNYQDSFRQNISQPLSYDLLKLLKTYRSTKNHHITTSNQEQLLYYSIDFHHNIKPISIQMFTQFNKRYEHKKYPNILTQQTSILQPIFRKAIFDALNQSITIQKPGSIFGQALPWIHSSKYLKNIKNSINNINSQNQIKKRQIQDLIFGTAIARIIQWGSYLCGFIQDTIQLQDAQIDDINRIKQQRIALLLQKMLIDQQPMMHNIDLQITQILLNVSQTTFDFVIKQFLYENQKIELKKNLFINNFQA